VASTPELNAQFNARNQGLMKQGLAPFAVLTQQAGGQQRYELHHRKPVHLAGELYDLDNLVVVTPVYHQEVLEPATHYGKKGGTK
jgi:hypothetical protein